MGKCIQPRSTVAGQPGKQRSNWKIPKWLPCPGSLPEPFLCVINTIFSKGSSIDIRFWKPSTVNSARRGAPGAPVWFMRVWDVHGGDPSALLAGLLQWEGNPLHFVGWDACHLHSPSLFLGREDGVKTRPGEHCLPLKRLKMGRWRVRARSINYTALAFGHWRTTQAGDLFIAEIPSLCSGRKAMIF